MSALEDVRSIVDINVYVWEPKAERWRMLTFGETQVLWEYRGRTHGRSGRTSASATELAHLPA